MKKIGILTSGGDCPGLNATIRGVAKALYESEPDVRIYGIHDGYHGLIHGEYQEMHPEDFSDILTRGGTILGTYRTPYKMMQVIEDDKIDKVASMKKHYREMGLDCLLTLGGNGTHKTANLLSEEGLNVIGLPKTIDNDIYGTDFTFGFNTAMLGDSEADAMEWVISLALANSEKGIMIDSQNPQVVQRALDCCGDRAVIINSVTKDPRFDPVISLAAERGCGLLCMPDAKSDADEIVESAVTLVEKVQGMGVKPQNIYIDAVVAAIAADDQAGVRLLTVISALKERLPDCHIVCGLSNISFGMPGRVRLNAALLGMAAACGMDSVIMDPLSQVMRETAAAVRLLSGEDEFGMDYITCLRGDFDEE